MKNIPSMLVVLGAIIVLISQAAACSLSDLDGRIAGGEEVKRGEFPFLVSLAIKESGGIYQCGGSIIDDRHIITAAHCVYRSIAVGVKLGCHKISKCKRWLEIDRYWIHHKYIDDQVPLVNDIAILRMKDLINFTDLIKPVKLPDRIEDEFEIGELLTVAGWGITHKNKPTTDTARKVNVEVHACSLPDKEDLRVCAGSPAEDACPGDSGGPLFRTDKASRQSTIVGIVSTGPGCTGKGEGAQYARVTRFLDWIEDVKERSREIDLY